MAAVRDNIFKLDWTDKSAVLDLAARLGNGMTVVKRYGRDTYSILHTAREADLLDAEDEVVHRT